MCYQQAEPFGPGQRNYEKYARRFLGQLEMALDEGGNLTLELITEFVRRSFSSRELAHGAVSEEAISRLSRLLWGN
jgi:hypothetical protein